MTCFLFRASLLWRYPAYPLKMTFIKVIIFPKDLSFFPTRGMIGFISISHYSDSNPGQYCMTRNSIPIPSSLSPRDFSRMGNWISLFSIPRLHLVLVDVFGRDFVLCKTKKLPTNLSHWSPGQHMARASIWITVSSILATFNIDKAVDAQGNTIDPPVNYMDGIVRRVVKSNTFWLL